MDASIIIPTFNRLWSLPEAIASCPRDPDVEIIVVDDGSTDGTAEWLADQVGITVIRQSNWGKPAAANAGVRAARGRYVRFLDSDDLLITDAAARQLGHVLESGADLCTGSYLARYVASGAEVPHTYRDCGDFLAQQLGECDSSHYSAYLFRRDFLDDVWHRPEFHSRDDRMFVLECALKMPQVTAFDEPTLIHRHHDRARIQFTGGSSRVVTNWQERRMFEKVAALLEARGDLTDRRKAAMSNNLWELALRVSAYDMREGREILDWLYALNPRFDIPARGVHRLYRTAGYPVAQRIVNAARFARNRYRALTA